MAMHDITPAFEARVEANHDSASDEELIEGFRTGDWSAAGALFERYQGAAHRFAVRIAGYQDADDVTAAAFDRVFGAMSRGHGPRDGFRNYLFTTVRSAHIDLLRARRHELAGGDSGELEDTAGLSSAPPKDAFDTLIDAELVRRALKQLPRRWQEVLWYTSVEGRALEEVARLIGVSTNAVGVLAFRAREGLRLAVLSEHVSVAAGGPHKNIVELLPRWIRGSLTDGQANAVRNHLDQCEPCSDLVAQLRGVNKDFNAIMIPGGFPQMPPPWANGPLDGLDRLIRAAARAAGSSGGAVGGAVASILVIGGTLSSHGLPAQADRDVPSVPPRHVAAANPVERAKPTKPSARSLPATLVSATPSAREAASRAIEAVPHPSTTKPRPTTIPPAPPTATPMTTPTLAPTPSSDPTEGPSAEPTPTPAPSEDPSPTPTPDPTPTPSPTSDPPPDPTPTGDPSDGHDGAPHGGSDDTRDRWMSPWYDLWLTSLVFIAAS